MFDDETAVNAEQEDVADSPIGEEFEDGPGSGNEDPDEEAESGEEEESDGCEADGEGAPEGCEAADAGQQMRKKPPQSKEDDSRYAAARREAEARAQAVRAEAEGQRLRMDAFAQQYGYATFSEMERAEQVRRYTQQGAPNAVAERLADMEARLAYAESEGRRVAHERAEQQKWKALFEQYPETSRADTLPAEVFDAIREGELPVNAYRDYLVKKLTDENAALRQNDTIRNRAIGSIRGRGSADGRSNPFIDGLFGK